MSGRTLKDLTLPTSWLQVEGEKGSQEVRSGADAARVMQQLSAEVAKCTPKAATVASVTDAAKRLRAARSPPDLSSALEALHKALQASSGQVSDAAVSYMVSGMLSTVGRVAKQAQDMQLLAAAAVAALRQLFEGPQGNQAMGLFVQLSQSLLACLNDERAGFSILLNEATKALPALAEVGSVRGLGAQPIRAIILATKAVHCSIEPGCWLKQVEYCSIDAS